MGKHVAEFPAFMDGARCFRRAMTSDSTREGELLEELAQAVDILALFRIDLGVGAFKVAGAQNTRRAMARAGQEDHVQIVFLDQPVQMNIDNSPAVTRSLILKHLIPWEPGTLAATGEPISEQLGHAHAQVIACPPIGV